MINLLRWSARIAGLCAFILGMMLSRFPQVHAHMALGGIVAIAVAILAAAALSARVKAPAAIAALVWAAVLVYVGIMQNRWLPGDSHWVVEVVHALLGIGAIGLAEMLAGAITRKRPA